MTTPNIARLLIDRREAAGLLSISEKKLWSETQAGRIPCVRIGTRVLYSPASLQKWIDDTVAPIRPTQAAPSITEAKD